ncbi:carboxypeptidase-like regulatory domain-containing protein [Flavobacterium sp.]|uniref:carboxypeptidase-like regulatory domain-containing protein n=1 Tax=Flavobacterium sp. TaxID=239 RepID=UPI00260B5251|nr:carboxypeptidase-like regulatory domain-containing protein [Flavobacterium sp.]
MKKITILFLLFSISFSAQIKGVVKDSLTGNPLPFVNIWVEGENSGATSEENGTFEIKISEKSKNLIFSAIGFEKKTIKIAEAKEVRLKSIEYLLDEVVLSNSKETKQIEIGKTKNAISQAFDNGPKIVVKFFPYKTSYKATKYIKKVTVLTDSKIENATIKLHFYAVDSLGFPSKELLKKDLILTVTKGVVKHTFDISEFNLTVPKSGLFVGFEKLLIERNKLEKEVTDLNSNTKKIQKTYFPFLLYNFVERDFQFEYSGGKWNKEQRYTIDGTLSKMRVNEPAINLILTN